MYQLSHLGFVKNHASQLNDSSFCFTDNFYDINFSDITPYKTTFNFIQRENCTQFSSKENKSSQSFSTYPSDICYYENRANETSLLIKEENSDYNVSIYPNPSSGNITIEANNIENINVEIYTISGQLIRTEFSKSNGRIHINGLSRGVYFVKININGNVINKKLIIE